jgi:hypothetical protein
MPYCRLRFKPNIGIKSCHIFWVNFFVVPAEWQRALSWLAWIEKEKILSSDIDGLSITIQIRVTPFEKNISGGSSRSVLTRDVRQLNMARDLVPLGDIDIFAYGFPCNDFSLVGEHKG